ncbi:MAG: heme ABC exporter ATP-binding protein CcmA [Sphingobacteriia bacterium]|nr:heme ABC exporter ATP-binding protein CcmA [Sphingobacteriia bacterium]
MLTLDNLSLSFNDEIIFQNLSINLAKTSIVKVKGINGAGKTTLLKIIAQILKPNTGEIFWQGKPLKHSNAKINYVGHDLGLKLNDTVGNNIAFWSSLTDSSLMFEAAIYYFRLEEIIDIKCEYLSQGWKKKVALARLLACFADIWVLDEPEINLDEDSKQRLFHAIDVRAGEGGIIFIASHSELPLKNYITLDIMDFIPRLETNANE